MHREAKTKTYEELERRVNRDSTVYVGDIEPSFTDPELRALFEKFGRIRSISRKHEKGQDYAFVKYDNPQDAKKVVDGCSNTKELQTFRIGLGDRKYFCGDESYRDLDAEQVQNTPALSGPGDSFDDLLKVHKKSQKNWKQETNWRVLYSQITVLA